MYRLMWTLRYALTSEHKHTTEEEEQQEDKQLLAFGTFTSRVSDSAIRWYNKNCSCKVVVNPLFGQPSITRLDETTNVHTYTQHATALQTASRHSKTRRTYTHLYIDPWLTSFHKNCAKAVKSIQNCPICFFARVHSSTLRVGQVTEPQCLTSTSFLRRCMTIIWIGLLIRTWDLLQAI